MRIKRRRPRAEHDPIATFAGKYAHQIKLVRRLSRDTQIDYPAERKTLLVMARRFLGYENARKFWNTEIG